MNSRRCVTSVFDNVAAFKNGLMRLHESNLRDVTAYTPVGMPELEQYLPTAGSPIRFFVLIAAVVGCISGFWMCIGSAYLYNLIVGGKHPRTLLPYAVIGFELTILIGGLTAVVMIILFARLRPGHPIKTYDPRFNVDRFGITVYCSEEQLSQAQSILEDAGAEEVHEQSECE
jgi:hypothetical protein